jgi:hypothetical protein
MCQPAGSWMPSDSGLGLQFTRCRLLRCRSCKAAHLVHVLKFSQSMRLRLLPVSWLKNEVNTRPQGDGRCLLAGDERTQIGDGDRKLQRHLDTLKFKTRGAGPRNSKAVFCKYWYWHAHCGPPGAISSEIPGGRAGEGEDEDGKLGGACSKFK